MPKELNIKFIPERSTKNTVRFMEVQANRESQVLIGTLYVQKAALTTLGYKEGDAINVTITL